LLSLCASDDTCLKRSLRRWKSWKKQRRFLPWRASKMGNSGKSRRKLLFFSFFLPFDLEGAPVSLSLSHSLFRPPRLPKTQRQQQQRLLPLLLLALATRANAAANPCTSTESRAGTIEYSASGPPNATTFAFTLTPTPTQAAAAAEKLPLAARIGPVRSSPPGPPAIASLGLRLSDAVAIEGGSVLRNASPAGTRAVVDGAPTFTWVVRGGNPANRSNKDSQQQQQQTFSVTLVANSDKAAAAATAAATTTATAAAADATNSSASSASSSASSSSSSSSLAPAPLASLCSQTPVGGGPAPLVSKVPVGGTCVFTLRTSDGGCGYVVVTSKLARAGNEAKGSSELPSAGGKR